MYSTIISSIYIQQPGLLVKAIRNKLATKVDIQYIAVSLTAQKSQ